MVFSSDEEEEQSSQESESEKGESGKKNANQCIFFFLGYLGDNLVEC